MEWRGVPPPGGRLIDGEPILPSCQIGNWRADLSHEERIRFLSPGFSDLIQTEPSTDLKSDAGCLSSVAITESDWIKSPLGTDYGTVEVEAIQILEMILNHPFGSHRVTECLRVCRLTQYCVFVESHPDTSQEHDF